MDEWVGQVMVARLSRQDAADLLATPILSFRAMALRTRLLALAELLADGTA